MRYRNGEEPYFPTNISNVLKWAVGDRLLGRRREAPQRFRMPTATPDAALLASAAPSLTWVGHASWIVRLGGLSFYIDPVWSDSLGPGVTRNVAPGIALEAAPRPDVVLVTHNHRDHLDAPTIKRLGPSPTYIVPEGLGPFFKKRGCPRVVELAWWQEHDAGGVTVALVPAQHWSQRGPFDRNDTLWGGYVLRAGGKSVYHSGDTSYFQGFAEIGRRFPSLDAALLPIGAYDPEWFMRRQHMNPDDAMRAFLDLGARLFCAMHWGTFKLTDEPLDEPPILLEQARVREAVSPERVWVARIGESRPL